jgi:hypothetical protein
MRLFDVEVRGHPLFWKNGSIIKMHKSKFQKILNKIACVLMIFYVSPQVLEKYTICVNCEKIK